MTTDFTEGSNFAIIQKDKKLPNIGASDPTEEQNIPIDVVPPTTPPKTIEPISPPTEFVEPTIVEPEEIKTQTNITTGIVTPTPGRDPNFKPVQPDFAAKAKELEERAKLLKAQQEQSQLETGIRSSLQEGIQKRVKTTTETIEEQKSSIETAQTNFTEKISDFQRKQADLQRLLGTFDRNDTVQVEEINRRIAELNTERESLLEEEKEVKGLAKKLEEDIKQFNESLALEESEFIKGSQDIQQRADLLQETTEAFNVEIEAFNEALKQLNFVAVEPSVNLDSENIETSPISFSPFNPNELGETDLASEGEGFAGQRIEAVGTAEETLDQSRRNLIAETIREQNFQLGGETDDAGETPRIDIAPSQIQNTTLTFKGFGTNDTFLRSAGLNPGLALQLQQLDLTSDDVKRILNLRPGDTLDVNTLKDPRLHIIGGTIDESQAELLKNFGFEFSEDRIRLGERKLFEEGLLNKVDNTIVSTENFLLKPFGLTADEFQDKAALTIATLVEAPQSPFSPEASLRFRAKDLAGIRYKTAVEAFNADIETLKPEINRQINIINDPLASDEQVLAATEHLEQISNKFQEITSNLEDIEPGLGTTIVRTFAPRGIVETALLLGIATPLVKGTLKAGTTLTKTTLNPGIAQTELFGISRSSTLPGRQLLLNTTETISIKIPKSLAAAQTRIVQATKNLAAKRPPSQGQVRLFSLPEDDLFTVTGRGLQRAGKSTVSTLDTIFEKTGVALFETADVAGRAIITTPGEVLNFAKLPVQTARDVVKTVVHGGVGKSSKELKDTFVINNLSDGSFTIEKILETPAKQQTFRGIPVNLKTLGDLPTRIVQDLRDLPFDINFVAQRKLFPEFQKPSMITGIKFSSQEALNIPRGGGRLREGITVKMKAPSGAQETLVQDIEIIGRTNGQLQRFTIPQGTKTTTAELLTIQFLERGFLPVNLLNDSKPVIIPEKPNIPERIIEPELDPESDSNESSRTFPKPAVTPFPITTPSVNPFDTPVIKPSTKPSPIPTITPNPRISPKIAPTSVPTISPLRISEPIEIPNVTFDPIPEVSQTPQIKTVELQDSQVTPINQHQQNTLQPLPQPTIIKIPEILRIPSRPINPAIRLPNVPDEPQEVSVKSLRDTSDPSTLRLIRESNGQTIKWSLGSITQSGTIIKEEFGPFDITEILQSSVLTNTGKNRLMKQFIRPGKTVTQGKDLITTLLALGKISPNEIDVVIPMQPGVNKSDVRLEI